MGDDEPILRTLRLLSLAVLRGMNQKEQVDLLDRAGFGQTDIAKLLGSTPNAISTRLAEVRKSRKTGRAKGKSEGTTVVLT